MERMTGKVAFVSGGASGIGRAIVERFLAEGAKVVFGDRNIQAGERLAAATGATFLRQDVAHEEDWVAAMAFIEETHGRLDVIVNNAGIMGQGSLEDYTVDTWNKLFSINVTGVMLGCKHAARLMQRNPGGASGAIINMSSNAGILATAYDCGYSATKGAVRLMTKSLGVHFARRGIAIRCNSIHPGPIDTPIFDAWRAAPPEESEALFKGLSEMVPLGRLGRPAEIASLAVFLASDESTFSTGSEFVADGGGSACLAGV